MKQKSAFFAVVVLGICIGVAAAQLAAPFAEYLAAEALRERGFSQISLKLSYPETGRLVVEEARANYKNMAFDVSRAAVENPFYFIWGGLPPALFAETLSLSVRGEGAPDIQMSPEAALSRLAEFARAYPFARAEANVVRLDIECPNAVAKWRGRCEARVSGNFLTAETRLRARNRAVQIGCELSRDKTSGYMWWKFESDDGARPVWGGMAWDEGKLASFIQTDADGESSFSAGQTERAFKKLGELFSLLAAAAPEV